MSIKKSFSIATAILTLITLFFLGLYSSAQLTAGRKALAAFGIEAHIGVLLGAVMVVAYCFAGGIRASIWTDAAQSVVMLVSMFILVGAGVAEAGGFGDMWQALEQTDAKLVDWDGGLSLGLFIPFVLGWVFARDLLYRPVLESMTESGIRVMQLYLVADEKVLEDRLRQRGDIDRLEYSVSRLRLIDELPFAKIDTSKLNPVEVAERVKNHVQAGV